MLIRRNPADISRIYVFDPISAGYLEVPYRDLSRPAISLWEYRIPVRRLRGQRAGTFDESALFRTIEELRKIEKTATVMTRTARRNRTRRSARGVVSTNESESTEKTALLVHEDEPLQRFDEIEPW